MVPWPHSFEVTLLWNVIVDVFQHRITSLHKHGDVQPLERRGRRLEMNRRLFFFGDGEFEGEAKVLDISTNGCKATSLTEVKIGLSLKLSLFLEMNSDGCGLITPSCDGSTVNVLGWNSRASDLLNARGFG